jgi:hypothetical protein
MITYNTIGRHGRFGNQMFQYAALYGIAKKNNYEFGVPSKNRSPDEYIDYCLPDCFKNLSAKDSSGLIQKNYAKEKSFSFDETILNIPDFTDISGYFQTEKYFKNYRSNILKEFDFYHDIKTKATDIRSKITDPVISLHIRLGDYLYLTDSHPVCSQEYYKEALSNLPNDICIYIFSDDMYKAANIFQSLDRKYIFPETNDKYLDMCLMTMCDYHIVANSSFSWWGAWLSDSKKVIGPSKWFGDNPNMPRDWSDIYCKEWMVI